MTALIKNLDDIGRYPLHTEILERMVTDDLELRSERVFIYSDPKELRRDFRAFNEARKLLARRNEEALRVKVYKEKGNTIKLVKEIIPEYDWYNFVLGSGNC